METLTELEKFHQLVLFKIINAKISDKTKWITVDKDTRITVFHSKPKIILAYNEWTFIDGNADDYWWEYVKIGTGEDNYIKVTIPPTIDWTECIWEFTT